MARVPVKFRCYRCNQLLGVSPSKIGKEVACPKCAANLIVPDLDDVAGSTPTAPETLTTLAGTAQREGSAVSASGITAIELLDEIRPEDIRVEPGIPWEPRPLATPGPQPPEPVETFLEPREVAEPLPAVLTTVRIEPPPRTVAEPASTVRARARDVVLPRSVVLAWSLFVLMALAFAFGAGLLAGHFLWRVH